MDQESVNLLKAYVEVTLKDEFSLDSVARHVGYSPYHLTRAFKEHTGQSVMEYVRERKIIRSAKDIVMGRGVYDVAMEYGFDTHAGYTRAFSLVHGCTPTQYFIHENSGAMKEVRIMDSTKLRIRPICKDDVNDLWENVYSAMTPRQILEVKILPSIEAFEKKEGIHLVAELDRKVVMALPMMRMFAHPVGFLFDNCFVLSHDDNDVIMEALLSEMETQCRRFGISTLAMWQPENSRHTEAFEHFGFRTVFNSGGMDYLMKSI